MVILVIVTLFPALGASVYIPAWIAAVGTQMLIVAASVMLFIRREDKKQHERGFDARSYTVFLFVIVLIETISQVVAPFDRYLAGNLLASGFVSANTYASVLSGAPIKVFIYAVATAIFPSLSEGAVRYDLSKFTQLYHRSLTVSILVILPIGSYMYIFDKEIVALIFERGRFDTWSTLMTAEVLKYYLIAMVFTALFAIQSKVFYALKAWRSLIVVRVVSIIPKVVLGVLLITDDWALALGGGTALMYALSFVVLEGYLVMKKNLRYNRTELVALFNAVCCGLVCTVTMAGVNEIARKFVGANSVLNLVAVAIVGCGVLLGMILGLRMYYRG
jgi:putative peptidoglycan lipid II flippase